MERINRMQRKSKPKQSKLPITAVIIARDSGATITECLRALAFCRRVVVGENGSQDDTARLARRAGADVRTVTWDGYARTKNALIASVRNGWVLSIDADEIVSPELAASIGRAVNGPEAVDGYWLSRRNYFLGREIRHCGWSPDWQLRLFRAGAGRFRERRVHEALSVDGRLERLSGALAHYSYRDLSDYLQRLNRYTSLAARERAEQGRNASRLRLWFDPAWTFIKMFLMKSGWRDGFPGFALCVLSALNTLVKQAKHFELQK
jgi:glycosyltransferase involved in cell wall biosynthesis